MDVTVLSIIIKEELQPKPKLSMFCALSQKDQHFLKNITIILEQIVCEWH